VTAKRFAIVSWLTGSVPTFVDSAAGQEIRLGAEFQINSYTSGYQIGPAVAVDSDGDFFVVWMNEGQYPSGFRLSARRFSSAGAALASEFQVNSVDVHLFTAAHDAATDPDGDLVVAWSRELGGSAKHIFARLFSSAGDPLTGELQVNTHTVHHPWGIVPAVATDSDGDFIVTWSGRQPSGYEAVFARRFSSVGLPLTDELQINSYTLVWRPFPEVASEPDGDFVVVWKRVASTEFPSSYDIAGACFSSAGARLGGEFKVNKHPIHYLVYPYPGVAANGDGDFVVAWNDQTEDLQALGVFARGFSSAGAALTGVFEVNAHTSSAGRYPVVAAAADEFVIAWTSFDGSGRGVLARRFATTGAPVAVEFQVNTYTLDDQTLFRSMAANARGAFVVTWSSNGQDGWEPGVFGQRFALPTATASPTSTATATPTVTPTFAPTSTSIAPALYAIPTLSRAALAVLVLLLLAIALPVLLGNRPS
jgi:hypothetical protein